MSMTNLDLVIERLTGDKAFRMKYCQDPDRTLESYLSPEEIIAIKTGDGHRLSQLACPEKWEQLTQVLCGPDPGP